MSTLLDALSAIERGDPYAMRKAVDAMGGAIEVLREERDDADGVEAKTQG